jgi:hypothetical protein
MAERIRNSPTIQEIIRAYLQKKDDAATVGEIYDHVIKRVSLTSKSPRASVFSVLTRMPDVERTRPGEYNLLKWHKPGK